jgi:CheY-like chemotaxis protein
MDEETLARAIEPFFSTKGVGKGTGLGLSMVHGLAAQLGGHMGIESRPGSGTSIDLWLPLAPHERNDAPLSTAQEPERREIGTVLLVDDEDLIRTTTADMLTEMGYRVIEANCAAAALRLVEEGLTPDLLMTDHLMPGMTGTELAQALRARRELPVLIISGYADSDSIDPDLARLTKPFRQDDLTQALARIGIGR